MSKRVSVHPTQAELEVLAILWRRGASTVRQVHDALQLDRRTGLTTTLKIIQHMDAKGLVKRSPDRPSRYSALVSEQKTQAGLLSDLLKRAFGGSMHKLLVRAVEDVGADDAECAQLMELIRSRRQKKER